MRTSGELGESGFFRFLGCLVDGRFAFIAVACTKMKEKYNRVSRLVVLPDYQGIGVGKRFLNFIAELYTSQTHLPFYLVTSNPQLIRGNIDSWRIKRIGHGNLGREDTMINRELVKSNSRRRLSVSMTYHPARNQRWFMLYADAHFQLQPIHPLAFC